MSLFLRSLSQNIAVLTPVVMSLTQSWVKKVKIGISCTNVYRKMKIKSKRYFEANYSFMKPLSQNFKVVSQYGDVINQKLARKRAQTHISCSNGARNMKI